MPRRAQRLPELEAQLQTEQGARQELEQKLSAFLVERKRWKRPWPKCKQQGVEWPAPVPVESGSGSRGTSPARNNLCYRRRKLREQRGDPAEKIVVAPSESRPEGRVVMVDTETEFVIVNLGANHGIKEEQVLAVFPRERPA